MMPATELWWLSCRSFTIAVEIDQDSGLIIQAAPVARTFLRQSLGSLMRWMERIGGFRYERLR
jgi:hypothetical protein